jgi:predicted GIY-YIG superfamily endonuclease
MHRQVKVHYDGRRWNPISKRGDTDIVYGMVDPRDSKVFYIGITNNLYQRFKEHMLMCGNNERKQARIQEILDTHMLPWMLTLEVVDPNVSARERETAYIVAYVQAGYELLNDEGTSVPV